MKKLNEIRKNKRTGHWSWIFGRKRNLRKSAGLTHQKKSHINGKWVKNVKLPVNPNPEDKTNSYINLEIQVQYKKSYGKRNLIKENWKMPKKNKKFVKHHFNEQYKNKHKDNKKRQT